MLRMSRIHLRGAILAAAAVFGAGSAGAAIIPLTAMMDGAQANAGAGTGSSGIGSATVMLDDSTNLLSWNISWSGLTGTPTAMHFHGPAPSGMNADIQVGTGVAGPPVIGDAIISASQAADLRAGLWYLNLHTSTSGAGEIRGQVVPEPGTLTLLGGGLLVLTAQRRVRRT